MQLSNYLFFDGQCEAAFTFYERCLRGKLKALLPASEVPAGDAPGCESRSVPSGDSIVHACLVVGDQLLMGSDWMADTPFERPQGFAVSLNVNSVAEAERVFNALADGGTVRMPLDKTFFAARFGMLADRFGIPWMVNCEKED